MEWLEAAAFALELGRRNQPAEAGSQSASSRRTLALPVPSTAKRELPRRRLSLPAKVKRELSPDAEVRTDGQRSEPQTTAKRAQSKGEDSAKRRRTGAQSVGSNPALCRKVPALTLPWETPMMKYILGDGPHPMLDVSIPAEPSEAEPRPSPKDVKSASAQDSDLKQMQLKVTKLTSQRGFAENRIAQLRKILNAERQKRTQAEQLCASLQEQLDSLNERLHTQKSISSFSQIASWQFQVDGGWEAFTPEGNEKMHQAYMEYQQEIPGSRHATIISGGVARAVDFQQMEQQHLQTQKVRQIRLWAGGPSQWTTPAVDLVQGKDVESFYVEVSDQSIWDKVRSILQNSGHALDPSTWCSCMNRAEVQSIHRIENIRLWHRYKARLAAMRQDHATYGISVGSADLDLDGYCNIMAGSQQTFDCGEALDLDVDEKILLHGTSWSNANSIVREGFDHRTCQHAFYGAGVYFACAACKSHQYTCKQHKWCCDCQGERTLIISRVALGDSYLATETRQSERRPPVRFNAAGTYDSIVVKPGVIKGHHQRQQVHQEFVIFDREQAYPSYVVQYAI